ncbi:CLUMA_CG006720, isoform A [Clunio marinus]|uniref:Splicing factor 45 n=1 Tax=Clunio marinus TaxID=568069 RepID=A0A1J1HYJ5_9DIPT|nr:CLUMA_CG006720, isoform A [Clunio marinus]
MSLYDDLDTKQIPDWSSGINKLMPQPQLSLKNKLQPPKKQLLTPVVSLKPKVLEENKIKEPTKPKIIQHQPIAPIIQTSTAINEWEEFLSIEDEYNPAVPNEYEKIVKERRERNKKEDNRKRHRSPSPTFKKSGFGGRHQSSDDEDNFRPSIGSNRIGTAIAPPKSLQESSPIVDAKIPNINSYGASAVAAKIMAKYGFKDGQGLGKQEQGISMALQVEKTSKRGGRIIHEKEIAIPNLPVPEMSAPLTTAPAPPPEQSITEMMKAPSKVIMLRNMVGPGEVDDELEPEVKEECNRKYGEVVTVHICEMPNVTPEETVRIFVEFTRIESAIKALVDLNGRFFGGRQVKCVFYSSEKYENFIFDD